MTSTSSPPPPRDEAALLDRARALEGRSLGSIADALGLAPKGKGRAGELLERALGATGGSAPVRDFPGIGVELKTIPVDDRGRPLESTFVCAISLADADRAEWASSWTRRKLAVVLWVPIVTPAGGGERVLGAPLLWRPTAAQEAVLAADFDDVMGLIGVGRVDALTGRLGRWLHARPKAAHARVRTRAYGPDDEPTLALPRGFYLRPRFTGALLRDPASVPA